eukprot:s1538_g5.t1
MTQASHIKIHWQRQHPEAWRLVHLDTSSTAKSMIAVFRVPCQFCDSSAKDSRQHADKCPALFQVNAVRHLRESGKLTPRLVGSKAVAPRKSQTVAAYKSFNLQNTPLGKAFGTGNTTENADQAIGADSIGQDQTHEKSATGSGSDNPTRHASSSSWTGSGRSAVPIMFRASADQDGNAANERSQEIDEASWACRLILHNPHSLCYMNANLVALLHAINVKQHPWRDQIEAEEMAFFSQYFPSGTKDPTTDKSLIEETPSKWQKNRHDKGEGRSSGGHGKGRTQGDHKRQGDWGSETSWSGWSQAGSTSSHEIQLALQHLQRLILRHEDLLNLIRSEFSFILFFRTSVPCAIIKPLFGAQRAWRTQKESNPESLKSPMRTVLMGCVIKELNARLEALRTKTQADQQKKLKDMGWLQPGANEDPIWSYLKWDAAKQCLIKDDARAGISFSKVMATVANEDPIWSYLKWDAAKQCLIKDDARAGISFSKVMATVAAMQILIAHQDTLQRFHPTRPLTEKMLLQGRNTEEPVYSMGWHRAEWERRRRNRSTETLLQSWLHVWLQC